MSNDVAALKVALLQLHDDYLALPANTVSDGLRQILVSFNSLMTGTANPNQGPVQELLGAVIEFSTNIETAEDPLRTYLETLIASM